MKRNFTLILLLLATNSLFAQITQNFDASFCSGINACWERFTVAETDCSARPSNEFAESICTAAGQNTTTPISGTGSLNGIFHFTNSNPGCGFTLYSDTIYSIAKGVDGNTVSFKIRFSQLAFPAGITFSVKVISGTYTSIHNYTPANQGTIFTINETIAGSGSGGPIMIVISTTGSFTVGSFHLVYDIDDFVTTGSLDLTNPCVLSIMPVKLNSFSAAFDNCTAVLNWKTSNEINASYFEIQRSTNGIDFLGIGRVNSENNSTGNNYKYVDNNPNDNINYYRLVMVDIDSRKALSNIIRVNGCKNSNITIYPNPVQDVLNISGVKAGNLIQVINSLGQIIITKTATQSTETLHVVELPKNIYTISIINNQTGQRNTHKFSKN
jgi:Secretion system C-terminal sorting domain